MVTLREWYEKYVHKLNKSKSKCIINMIRILEYLYQEFIQDFQEYTDDILCIYII